MGFWSLYILNVSGTLLYQRCKGMSPRPFSEIAVFQALHTTSHELKSPISTVTTAATCLALKSFGSEDDYLLFILESEIKQTESNLLDARFVGKLDALYDSAIMIVGRKDLFPSSFLHQERLKKELRYGSQLYESVVDYEVALQLSNHTSMSPDLQEALTGVMRENELDYLAVWKRGKLYMSSIHWNDLSSRDQTLLGLFRNDSAITDRPIFLPNSSLNGEEKGSVPIRFLQIPLNAEFVIGILCGKKLPLPRLLQTIERVLSPAICKTISALSFNQPNLDLQAPNEVRAWACFEGKATIWRCFSRDIESLHRLLDLRWFLDFPEGIYTDRFMRTDSDLIMGIKKGPRVLWTLATAHQSEADFKAVSEAILDYIAQYLDNTSHVFGSEGSR